MRRAILGGVAVLAIVAPASTFAQQAPAAATYITDEQVKAVNKTPGTDRTLQVFDLGKTAMSIGIVHRGPTGAARDSGGAAPAAGGGARGNAPAPVPCGDRVNPVPADATPGAIAHDQTTETYIIISG